MAEKHPPQRQDRQPGLESAMHPRPEAEMTRWKAAGRLEGRAGQPDEVAACFIFLACDESSYVSGQTIHVNGGEPLNG